MKFYIADFKRLYEHPKFGVSFYHAYVDDATPFATFAQTNPASWHEAINIADKPTTMVQFTEDRTGVQTWEVPAFTDIGSTYKVMGGPLVFMWKEPANYWCWCDPRRPTNPYVYRSQQVTQLGVGNTAVVDVEAGDTLTVLKGSLSLNDTNQLWANEPQRQFPTVTVLEQQTFAVKATTDCVFVVGRPTPV